jgi:serine protease Do
MTRLIVRHLTGGKANQESVFSEADLAAPLTLGRDPGNRVVFEDADDAVSRNHARIERTAEGYRLIDAGSANGSFVNRVRVAGETALAHGDMVQLGRGGPEFSFQLDPPPPNAVKATRVVSDYVGLGRATRIASPEAPIATGPVAAEGASPTEAPARIGRATVERLITAEKKRSSRTVVNVAGALLALVGAVGTWQYIDARDRQANTAKNNQAQLDAAKADADKKIRDLEAKNNLGRRVKAEYGSSTVYIEASWRLTETRSGAQIFHSTMPIEDKGSLPAYVRLADGSLEPLLQLDSTGNAKPIGGSHSGTGFVVSDNGLILTNRHVAAAWHSGYSLPFPGVVVERKQNERKQAQWSVVDVLQDAPASLAQWVPSRSKHFRTQGVGDSRSVTGVNSSISVTFPTSKLRVPAALGTISPEHDVALVKIDAAAGQLKKVELRDSYDTLVSGDTVAVLGYPAVSATSFVITESSDGLMRSQDVASVPEVSVNQGIVSKIVRNRQSNPSPQAARYLSLSGDMFEMSINSAGQGNSGGPVFDVDGKVIGIFATVSTLVGHALQTGAVPIRYGLELLDPTRSAVAPR